MTALYSYDEGCGNHQVNEQYKADGSWDWDNVNGRSSYDFYYNTRYDSEAPQVNTYNVAEANCAY